MRDIKYYLHKSSDYIIAAVMRPELSKCWLFSNYNLNSTHKFAARMHMYN